jgi:pyruvate-formate lyase
VTVEEMQAEVARVGANLLKMCEEAIHECLTELAVERNPYHREFMEKQLEHYREIRQRFATAA